MQYNFDIEIPQVLITKGLRGHDAVHFDLLEGKVIIGLCGYAKSGKDTVAEKFINDYGFYRIAFADNIKKDMNLFMRELVYEDIKRRGIQGISDISDVDFVNPKNREIKEILRPYIIWLGETLRNINGPYFWINRAFQYDANGQYNIVISDVRRPKELDIFRNSNNFIKRTKDSLAEGHYIDENINSKVNSYSTLFFWVNQYELTDTDPLTIQTIQEANEQWLFDDTIYIDSRIPQEGNYREIALKKKIESISLKYGIKRLSKREIDQNTKGKQVNIFDSIK